MQSKTTPPETAENSTGMTTADGEALPPSITNGYPAVTRQAPPSPAAMTPETRARLERITALLDEWMADETGYDEETWPDLKEVLDRDRPSSRRLFVD